MNNDNNQINKPIDTQRITDQLTKLCKEIPIRQWDLGASSSIDLSAQVDSGEAKQIKGAQRNSITIRVWNDQGLVGATSTSDLTDDGIYKAIKGAKIDKITIIYS